MRKGTTSICFWSLTLTILHQVSGDFGDYADYTFDCPAETTCPVVCVANHAECPWILTCAEDEKLCSDGHCIHSDQDCSDMSSNPCEENACGNNIACPKIVKEYDDCFALFQPFYDRADNCTESSAEEPTISWTSPGFVFCYAWISIVTVLMLGWCALNQRILPVGDKTSPLDDFSGGKGRRKSSYQSIEPKGEELEARYSWTQTAYRKNSLGSAIYALVILTMIGFQVLLAFLVAFYYAQQNGRFAVNPFESETQVLLAFEITWMVAFFWQFSLKWPSSIFELFLRRSKFGTATHIAVFSPTGSTCDANMPRYVRAISNLLKFLRRVANCVYAPIFSVVDIPKIHGKSTYCKVDTDETGTRYFMYRLRRYNFSEEKGLFVPGKLHLSRTIGEFLEASNGLSEEEASERRAVVGSNIIPMEKPSFFWTVINEFNKSFYLWQNLASWVWLNFWYWHMGVVNTFVYCLGGLVNSFVKYRNDSNLYRLGEIQGTLEVLRDGKFKEIQQEDAVPGDVVKLSPGVSHCDLVIIKGQAILVDESALTGEATPVAKCPVDPASPNELYSPTDHKKCTISAGTTVLETESNTVGMGVILNTGSFTAKGILLRDILFYERHVFKFDWEVQIIILILILYAIFGFWLMVYFLGDEPIYSWFYGMYVVGASVPPLLPTTFVVSVGISSDRLFKKRVATADSQGILVAGKVKRAFFDKTGTLTNQGMEFMPDRSFAGGESNTEAGSSVELEQGMSVTHTLTKASEGRYIGHFIDVTMFESSGAKMEHVGSDIIVTTNDGTKLTVIKRFEFDHHRMMQSVIVRDETTQEYKAFVKGSPETIQNACVDGVPSDFDTRARSAAKEGIYQICVASKMLSDNVQANTISRDDIEVDLSFVGFLSFKNTLKTETPAVISQLKNGDVKPMILTGDNVFTGIHIAKECGIIEDSSRVILGKDVDDFGNISWIDAETDKATKLPKTEDWENNDDKICLAMSGIAWSTMTMKSKATADAIFPHIKVIGRCTPNDKVSVVAFFVKRGFITLMCGDGGNDCGALKTAHVGVALSEAEASIVSPFTSLDLSISSVLDVLKEGRCCLASAFASYKFMIMYGQVEVFLQLVLAYYEVGFGEWPWVFFDGAWLLSLAFSLPLARPARRLAPERPTSALLGMQTMSSTLGILAINVSFLLIALALLRGQDWYQCRKFVPDSIANILEIGDNYESTVVFLIAGWQFPASAFPYSFGFAHRAPFWKNYIFLFFFVGWCALHIYVTLVPSNASCLFRVNCNNDDVLPGVLTREPLPIQNPFNTTEMPQEFRETLVILMVANLVANVLWESAIVNSFLKNAKRRWGQLKEKKERASNEYSREFHALDGSPGGKLEGESQRSSRVPEQAKEPEYAPGSKLDESDEV